MAPAAGCGIAQESAATARAKRGAASSSSAQGGHQAAWRLSAWRKSGQRGGHKISAAAN